MASGRDISIHAPPRGATTLACDVLASYWISIHAPPRGATKEVKKMNNPPFISIHAPPRGATSVFSAIIMERLFQFTPLREGRLHLHLHLHLHRIFQFTPLREGRLLKAVLKDATGQISIHAPPRGATGKQFVSFRVETISIHAPPRGATLCGLLCLYPPKLFQFTPLREGRPLPRSH